MNAVPAVLFITVSSIGLVGLLGYCLHTLLREVEQYRLRILKLSRLLQRIEYTTGEPYFTTSGNYLEIEQPEWLLESIQKESLRQSFLRKEGEYEEEENQEEENQEEEQEENQEEEQEENQEEENQEEENQENQEEEEEEKEESGNEDANYVPLHSDIQLSPLEQIARSE